ncbi:hypothetical protein [Nonomuraea aridisoli]|uniref:hypothetical protein n=1 Tax=Nonomuraea aridisoli TaxID=2070368 RepID=UPI0015E8AC34|nr:hypothetical protein [Nonomuraea aridisoli]
MGFRSSCWYAGDDRDPSVHRAWTRRGLPREAAVTRADLHVFAGSSGDRVGRGSY